MSLCLLTDVNLNPLSRGAVVEKVCEYMAFKTYYESVSAKDEVPVHEFMERIPPEVALELYVSFLSVA